MKKFIIITSLLAFAALIGCSSPDALNGPAEPVKKDSPNWVVMPKKANMSVEAEFDVSELVSGSAGGTLSLHTSYSGGINGLVTIDADLVFSPGAFSGDKLITLHVNDEYCESTFGPSSVFDVPAVYNIRYTGLDLSGVDPSSVVFIYDSEDGTTEVIENEGISVDVSTGTLEVLNAQLPHFSRFGFVN